MNCPHCQKKIEIELKKACDVKTDDVSRIIKYLNAKAKTNYRPSSRKTKDMVRARLNEGFEVTDFKTVIDNKVKDWLNDPAMVKYLRPETLFSNKFESYLNQKSAVNKKSSVNSNRYPEYKEPEQKEIVRPTPELIAKLREATSKIRGM